MDFASLAAQLNAGTVLPELIVIATLLLVVVGDLIVGRTASSRWTPYVSLAGLLLRWSLFSINGTRPVQFRFSAVLMMTT